MNPENGAVRCHAFQLNNYLPVLLMFVRYFALHVLVIMTWMEGHRSWHIMTKKQLRKKNQIVSSNCSHLPKYMLLLNLTKMVKYLLLVNLLLQIFIKSVTTHMEAKNR